MIRENRVQWFNKFSERVGIPQEPVLNLATGVKIDIEKFEAIKIATQSYIRSCFGNPKGLTSEQSILERLNEDAHKLANRTPNGLLVAKKEFQSEFNDVHKAAASWLRSLDIPHLVDGVFCPISVRVVAGNADAELNSRPYSSSKLHVDLWSGDPADTIDVIIPVMGDIERTTVEFHHPPDDFEEKYLRVVDDYDEVKHLAGQCIKYPINPSFGFAYFLDQIVLHKTVRNNGGVRVSISFAIRRPSSHSNRMAIEALCETGRLAHYIDRDEWLGFGTKKFLKFKDTYADAAKGIFTNEPHREKVYEVVDRL